MCKGAVYSRHPFDLVLFKQLYWWASCIALDIKQNQPSNCSPIIRSGEWSDIGSRTSMEDTHVCIANLAKKFRYNFLDDEAISVYRVWFDHSGSYLAIAGSDIRLYQVANVKMEWNLIKTSLDLSRTGGLILLRPDHGGPLQFVAAAAFLNKLYKDYLGIIRSYGGSCDSQSFSMKYRLLIMWV